MDILIQADPVSLEAASGKLLNAMVPANPGPFQDGLSDALGVLMAWEQERFSAYSDGQGDWPDLSPSTKLKRLYKTGYRRGRHPRGEQTALEVASGRRFPILRDTDTLFESLMMNRPYHQMVFTEISAASQTTVPYGSYHQFGGTIPGRPPKREYIVTPPDAVLQSVAPAIAQGYGAQIALAG